MRQVSQIWAVAVPEPKDPAGKLHHLIEKDTHSLKEMKLSALETCIAVRAVETAGKPTLCKVSLTKAALLSAALLRVAVALLCFLTTATT